MSKENGGCMLLLLCFLSLNCQLISTEVVNVTLDAQSLASGLTVNQMDELDVYCVPGQDDYEFWHVLQSDFENCTVPSSGYTRIGSCQNSPLLVNIVATPFKLPGIVSFEDGKDFYFAVYEVSGGQVTSTEPCMNGLKFSFYVRSADDNDVVEPVVSSSAVAVPVSPSPTAEVVQSSVVPLPQDSSNVISTSIPSNDRSHSNGASMAGETASVRGTTSTSTSTSTRGRRTTSTTVLQESRGPRIEGVQSETSEQYAYIGGGAGGLILIIIIVIAIVVVTVIAVITFRRRRNHDKRGSYYMDAASHTKNGTLRPILNEASPVHSPKDVELRENSARDQGQTEYDEVSVRTFSHIGSEHFPFNRSDSTDPEGSIQSSTSHDQLLPPSSPIRGGSTVPPLTSIPEGQDHSHQETKIDIGDDIHNSTESPINYYL